jgi:hypothetical protein
LTGFAERVRLVAARYPDANRARPHDPLPAALPRIARRRFPAQKFSGNARVLPEFLLVSCLLPQGRPQVASNNGGHKTVRLAKEKGGSSEFYCFVTFSSFETKQIKFLRCSHLF